MNSAKLNDDSSMANLYKKVVLCTHRLLHIMKTNQSEKVDPTQFGQMTES